MPSPTEKVLPVLRRRSEPFYLGRSQQPPCSVHGGILMISHPRLLFPVLRRPWLGRNQLLRVQGRAQARMGVEKRLQFPQSFLLVGIGPDDVVTMQRRAPPVDPVPVHPPAKMTASDV